ncbi:hypothetical protein E3P77_02769 [Wallemia ichthyophaga]|nr:hypothetical protein E3P77_02769 [Wallemia ichthyophaga]
MPRGLQTARKLKTIRRDNRWADLQYNKKALGNFWKTSPTGGSSHAKGIVLEKVGVEAKQPNSAIRKCVRVQLIKNGKKVTAFVPNDGGLNFVDENDEVLISGFGKKGKARGDCPGVRFKVVKVSGERYQGKAKILRATLCVVLASRPADNIKINKFSKSLMSFRSK